MVRSDDGELYVHAGDMVEWLLNTAFEGSRSAMEFGRSIVNGLAVSLNDVCAAYAREESKRSGRKS